MQKKWRSTGARSFSVNFPVLETGRLLSKLAYRCLKPRPKELLMIRRFPTR